MNNFYITTTLPYVNSEPHLGFAKEIIIADIIARHKKQLGYKVFFNTGTDEHGQKIYQKALESGVDTKLYCDEYSKKFKDLKLALNLSFDNFVRTTDQNHVESAKEFWNICLKNGDIYKKNYQVKYCVGCEMEKTDSELENDLCPLHPNQKIELIDEENYFFRFSKFQEKLLEFYDKNPDFIKPKHRFNEIINFVSSGLNDFSISRLKEKMPWGVSVPGDDTQVMYVWFDALVNYISCLGWPQNLDNFNKWWPGVQVCGKDNLRPQTAMWQAMLMSANLPNSSQVLILGFLTSNGQKISKSQGNAVDPIELSEKYGADVVRYYLTKEIPTFEDGDFSYEKIEKLYVSDLVNGLGNLVARVSNLIEKSDFEIDLEKINYENDVPLIGEKRDKFFQDFFDKMSEYRLNEALLLINNKIKETDEYLSQETPWKMPEGKKKKEVLQKSAQNILLVALLFYPFMPESCNKIITQFNAEKIVKGDILFPKLS